MLAVRLMASRMNVSFLQELLNSVAEQGRQYLPRSLGGAGREDDINGAGVRAGLEPRRSFRRRHRARDPAALPHAFARRTGWRSSSFSRAPCSPMRTRSPAPPRPSCDGSSTASIRALQRAVESPRLEFFRRLNLAPGATAEIVAMRRDLIAAGDPSVGAGRQRSAPSAGVVVQPRLPGAAPHRLANAGHHPRQDHRLRGGARNPGLGRPAPPPRSGRPALFCVLPSLAGGRAADLRRGGADG